MDGLEAPAVEQDQPVTDSAPESLGTSAEESFTTFNLNDYEGETREAVERAYKQLQADYTRKRQEESARVKEAENAQAFMAALSSDDTRADAIRWLAENYGENAVYEALGIELEQEADDEDTTDDEFRDPRVDQLLAEREKERAELAREQQLSHIEQLVDAQFAELKITDEDEQQLILADAISSFPPGEDGAPQVKAAFERQQKIWERKQKAWLESKQAPRPSSGTPGEPKFDIRDRDARIKRMAAALEANQE